MRVGGKSRRLKLSLPYGSHAMSTVLDHLADTAVRPRAAFLSRAAGLLCAFVAAQRRAGPGSSERADLILRRQRHHEEARARADRLLRLGTF